MTIVADSTTAVASALATARERASFVFLHLRNLVSFHFTSTLNRPLARSPTTFVYTSSSFNNMFGIPLLIGNRRPLSGHTSSPSSTRFSSNA